MERVLAGVFCLLGNFVEIVLVNKNAPRGSHCGGAENIAIAIRRRRRMSQATFFISWRFMQRILSLKNNKFYTSNSLQWRR